jgi:peptidoglycan hydrolase-like protein with peptidoglycan-binding domain
MKTPFGTGAIASKHDPRTIKHDAAMSGAPLTSGGVAYYPIDIEHQHKVGICTAISLTQNRSKAKGQRYSADFQYLLQKKYFDANAPIGWREGSSIFHALKVGKKYGFLPVGEWTHTTEDDRYLPYAQYIAKLKAIPDAEIDRLLTLCVDKIPGYASVDAADPQKIAKAIDDSEAGVLCMYGVSDAWWYPSWLAKDINPLKLKPATSFHAIIGSMYDYTNGLMQKLSNTWGDDWCLKGNADINHENYQPIEVWSILKTESVIPPYKFTHDLWFGKRDVDNIELQRRLGVSPTDLNFGPKTLQAVLKYQRDHGITPTGYCGPRTRLSLNTQ